jgi:hypothetical protein
MENPAWQLYDVARRWYCPFCAQATAVKVREGGRISLSVLKEIERHLGACPGYERGRGEEKPLAYLKSMVAFSNRTEKMAEQIRRKIETDAAWRLRDAEGHWVCLYCRRVIEAIDFTTSVQMTEVAPLEVARHLVSQCEGFRGAQQAREQASSALSSATLEIARLGSAPTSDVVRLSGSPPAAVSGEYAAASSVREAPPFPERPAAAVARPPVEALEDREEWRRSIHTTLSEVRSNVLGRAPEGPPPPPEIDGIEIRTFYRGARPHPADFADVAVLDARRIAIAVVSVSGEGAEAGLFLPVARKLLRTHGRPGRAPAETLAALNAELFPEIDRRTVIAVTYGVLDVRTLVYRFARAGGEPPLWWRPPSGRGGPRREGALCEIESVPGIGVGAAEGRAFEASLIEREVLFEPGDLLVEFTRGAVAAEDVDGQPLTAGRFYGLIRRYGNHEADYFIVKFGQFFEDWTRGAPLREDACVLALKIKEQQ